MPAETIAKRVETLENTMNGPGGVLERLDLLRSDLDTFRGEFLQFRDETRAEFSAVREEVGAVRREFREEIRGEIAGLRTHMLVLHEEVISRLALLHEALSRRS